MNIACPVCGRVGNRICIYIKKGPTGKWNSLNDVAASRWEPMEWRAQDLNVLIIVCGFIKHFKIYALSGGLVFWTYRLCFGCGGDFLLSGLSSLCLIPRCIAVRSFSMSSVRSANMKDLWTGSFTFCPRFVPRFIV